MSNKDSTTKEWVNSLRSTAEDAHRTVRTREAAPLPSVKPQLDQVISKLLEQQREVRQEVITALGEEPDELTITVLAKLARSEPDWRLRQDIVKALSVGGGEIAVHALMHLAERDPIEDIQISAIHALGELALRTHPELTVRTRGARVKGAIRVRGAVPSWRVSPEAETLLALLDAIRHRDLSQRVRDAADEVLGQLDL